ncbi:PKD domain-containing protein [Flexithrix dorotheae]|uniref:Ig-like domain-containing protein n=1 Tax=Flexithrix dorotheae TaxID=70993 RepID=UPI000368B253|nr:PKD domain-containing protein [Flexithrix dorotheae]
MSKLLLTILLLFPFWVFAQRTTPYYESLEFYQYGPEATVPVPEKDCTLGDCSRGCSGADFNFFYQAVYQFELPLGGLDFTPTSATVTDEFKLNPLTTTEYKMGESYFIRSGSYNSLDGSCNLTDDTENIKTVGQWTIKVIAFNLTDQNLSFCQNEGLIDLKDFLSFYDHKVTFNHHLVNAEGFFDTKKAETGSHVIPISREFYNGTKTLKLTLEVKPSPVVFAGEPIQICIENPSVNLHTFFDDPAKDPKIQFNGNSITQKGKWTLPAEFNEITITAGEINPADFKQALGNKEKISVDLNYTYQAANGCVDADTRTITFFKKAAAPQVTSTSVCGIQDKTMVVENPNPLLLYRWYKAFTLGNGQEQKEYLGESTELLLKQVSENIKLITVAEYRDISGCFSEESSSTISFQELPELIPAANIYKCGPGNYTLSANLIDKAIQFRWYSTASGGQPLFNQDESGKTFQANIPASGTYDFFVESYRTNISGEECTNPKRAKISLIVRDIPQTPDLKPFAPVCGEGQKALISILNPNNSPNTKIIWLDKDGQTVLGEGNTFEPAIWKNEVFNNKRRFFVASSITYESGETCQSVALPFDVTLVDLPARPTNKSYSFCYGEEGIIAPEAQSGIVAYKWYSKISPEKIELPNPSGNSRIFNLGPVYSSGIYYVSAVNETGCESLPAEIQVTMEHLPGEITNLQFPAEICVGEAASISASGSVYADAYLFLSESGDSLAQTNGIFSTGILLENRTYSYQVVPVNGRCKGPGKWIQIKVNALPPKPIVDKPSPYCGSSNIILNATGAPDDHDYFWYESLEATSAIGTGPTLHLPDIAVTTAYFVAIKRLDHLACQSERIKVRVEILSIPDAPEAESQAICKSSGRAELSVNNPVNLNYRWYANEKDETPIFIGEKLVTEELSQSKTFFVTAQSLNGCESDKVPVSAIVYGDDPIDIGDSLSICQFAEAIDLMEEAEIKGGIFTGKGIVENNSFDPGKAGFGTYQIDYLYQTEDGCDLKGHRIITVTAGLGKDMDLSASLGERIQICEGSSTLDLSNYTNYSNGKWSGAGVIGHTFDPQIAGTGLFLLNYTVEINGCIYSGIKEIEVMENTAPLPNIQLKKEAYCPGELVEITAYVLDKNSVKNFHWYDELGNELTTGEVLQIEATPDLTVFCKAENLTGCLSEAISIEVPVLPLPTSIQAGQEEVNEHEAVRFSALEKAGNTTLSYQWSFGDGGTSTLPDPAYFYHAAGDYQVTLTVENSAGCLDTLTSQIKVKPISTSEVLGLADPDELGIAVFPNPFKNEINLSLPNEVKGEVSLWLINATGQVIWEGNTDFGGVKIDTNNLPRGLYFLKFRLNEKYGLIKLTKTN